MAVALENKEVPIQYIKQIKGKLKSGEYPTEEVKCFCEADFKDRVLIESDRFGIPHRMVMCEECGLVRANPRMTKEAYGEFYNNEYRPLYDWFEYKANVSKDFMFINEVKAGHSLKTFVDYFDIPTNVVFDIGCNCGAWLMPFKEEGSEIYGVDYYRDGVEYGVSQGLDLMVGGVHELEHLNKKADLIILNHVIEHFLDFESELNQIRNLLKPGGLLFIGTPGFYTAEQQRMLWQNAHTYQFTADTLGYVMRCLGWEEYFLDESIKSMWSSIPYRTQKETRPLEALEYFKRFLSGEVTRLPRVKTMNKFDFKTRKANMDKTLEYHYTDLGHILLKHKGEGKKAIIISGGPSVDNYVDKIKELQKDNGLIFTIERMYPWCHEHGITPDYCIVLDASEDVVEGFTHINPETIHVLATQANPKAFELLRGYKNYIFTSPQGGIDIQNYWHKHDYGKAIILNTGGSVTLCAMTTAMTLGVSKLRIFGFDCHTSNGEYANGIAGVGTQKFTYEVNIEGRRFITNTSFLSFLQQFFTLMQYGYAEKLMKNVFIYGDSMVKWASKLNIDGDKEVL